MIHETDKDAECFSLTHVHEEWSDEEAQTLAVANVLVVQREALQYSSEHPLAFSTCVPEQIHTRE